MRTASEGVPLPLVHWSTWLAPSPPAPTALRRATLRAGDWRAARAAIQAGADVNEKITMQNKNGSSMINSVTPVYLAAQ